MNQSMSMSRSRAMLEVLNAGVLSTVQDLGRPGWTHLGISPGGAADRVALKLGNRLVGNPDDAAGIEMTLSGGNFRFHCDTWVAITGTHCDPRISGTPTAMWYSFPVREGEVLSTGTIGAEESKGVGTRSYLCIAGGIEAPVVLGSRSTFLSGRWGGHAGRALVSGDCLPIGAPVLGGPMYRRVMAKVRDLYLDHRVLHVTQGPQWDWFSKKSQDEFLASDFRISTESNRNGLRVSGPSIASREKRELLTEGVSAGAIQIPAGGQPLLLFCEQQTTGGYPKIANVIRSDLFRLGQCRPGENLVFKMVSLEEAWQRNRAMEDLCRTAVYPV